MSGYNNLSKLFRYVNADGESITFDYGSGYLISKPNGIDSVSVEMGTAVGINQAGVIVQTTHVQERPVTINGIIVGENQAASKERLLNVIRPDLKGRLYADDYYLDVYPTETPTVEAGRIGARFQFSLSAAYPYWVQENVQVATLMGVAKRFKFPWNISRPYRFGEVVQAKFINIRNSGQVAAPYTMTLRALDAVKNPWIDDAKSSKMLKINKSMIAGEILTVAVTHDQISVTSTVDGDCLGALDIGSDLFELQTGDNVWKPGAESGLENLQIDVAYAIEKAGVIA